MALDQLGGRHLVEAAADQGQANDLPDVAQPHLAEGHVGHGLAQRVDRADAHIQGVLQLHQLGAAEEEIVLGVAEEAADLARPAHGVSCRA